MGWDPYRFGPLWGWLPSEAMHLTDGRIYCRYLAPGSTRLPVDPCTLTDGGIYCRYLAPWSTRLCCGTSTLWKDTIKGLGPR